MRTSGAGLAFIETRSPMKGQIMEVASSLILVAAGAIMRFAVSFTSTGFGGSAVAVRPR